MKPEESIERDDELSALLRQQARRHTASPALRAGIQAQVALAEAGRRPRARVSLGALLRWLSSGWRGPSLGFALGLLCALPLARWQGMTATPAVAEVQADELVASHVRALGGGPLFQVASSDRHTVKPWYQGKLDYSPPVPDLSDQGFPLAGGRVEALHGEATAALAYRRHLHVIDVYIRPSRAPAAAPTLRTERGFHVLAWRDGAMQYWAVSDVEAAELQRFALSWQARTAP